MGNKLPSNRKFRLSYNGFQMAIKKGLDPLTTTKIKMDNLMVIELCQHRQIAIDFGCRNLMVTEKVSITII